MPISSNGPTLAGIKLREGLAKQLGRGVARERAERFASGGGVPPWIKSTNYELQRQLARGASTPIKSAIPGRTDKIPAKVPVGSYVIPADVVSGLGEGNTDAGSAIIGKMISSMPFGIRKQQMPRGRGLGRKFASGGSADANIIVAGGEYIVHPQDVAKIGHGDIDAGHEILDRFVKNARHANIKTLKKLPGPKK
jgi:hypothetical protein